MSVQDAAGERTLAHATGDLIQAGDDVPAPADPAQVHCGTLAHLMRFRSSP
jgi:hypothetical protein